jgi:tetratricopeptide (TPR) repeat protein
MKQNDFQQAAELYRDILNQCDSKHDKLVYELKIYECFLNSGKYGRVISQLNSFINNNKSDHKDLIAKATLLKGQVYIQLREFARAYDTFSHLLTDYPETQKIPDAKFFIGYCKMLEGKLDEAKELFDFISKYYPDNSYASKSHLFLWKIESIKNSRDVKETLTK